MPQAKSISKHAVRQIFFNLLNKQYLADMEEHLGVTISQTGTDMKVPMDEFDGKVVYGQKRKANGNKRLLRFHF